jgi:hypothetical protein
MGMGGEKKGRIGEMATLRDKNGGNLYRRMTCFSKSFSL